MCRVPVIYTKNGGVGDVIYPDNSNGLLVTIRDYEAIAKNIFKLINKDVDFPKETIRNIVIEQSGTTAFYQKIFEFHND
jgi:glycosyltransferase involved in cell wall biosynthesis